MVQPGAVDAGSLPCTSGYHGSRFVFELRIHGNVSPRARGEVVLANHNARSRVYAGSMEDVHQEGDVI